jgi:secondary thiamine-phosphate synthase enzyme
MVRHFELVLGPFERGIHLITGEILDELKNKLNPAKGSGLLTIFCQHTSCAITINESYDSSVRRDLNEFLNRVAPEEQSYYTHTTEGPDDLPAHIKTSLWQSSVTIPMNNGELMMGTWQGIYFGEFRNSGGSRKFTLSFYE